MLSLWIIEQSKGWPLVFVCVSEVLYRSQGSVFIKRYLSLVLKVGFGLGLVTWVWYWSKLVLVGLVSVFGFKFVGIVSGSRSFYLFFLLWSINEVSKNSFLFGLFGLVCFGCLNSFGAKSRRVFTGLLLFLFQSFLAFLIIFNISFSSFFSWAEGSLFLCLPLEKSDHTVF